MDERWEPTFTPGFMEKIGLGELDLSFATTDTLHPTPAPAPASNNANGNEGRDSTLSNAQFNEDLFGRYETSRMSCRVMRQKISSGLLYF